jgi:phosphate transport system permease protein
MSELRSARGEPEGVGLEADRHLRRRYAAERRFRLYGAGATALAVLALAVLLGSVVRNAAGAFVQHVVTLDIDFDDETLGLHGSREQAALRTADYAALVRKALGLLFPEATERQARRELGQLMSSGAAFDLQGLVMAEPGRIGTRSPLALPLSDEAAAFFKGGVDASSLESERRLSDRQIAWLGELERQGRVEGRFNRRFFSAGDSREPELAGIWGAVVGSFLTLVVALALSFPLGVAAAVYLEEFAPRNRWTELVEVNINNLAAVPSVVFGLLGLAVFLGLFGLPRSAPLVGGMILALMTLPTLIIAGRAALKSVPPSVRQAALAVGASPMQVVGHHVLPLAMPGILTGTILGMARALGETAPLLMIGMVAFIVDIPSGFTTPATVLPVQVFLWADSPERAFVEKTSAAILVLLAFLLAMNLVAVLLRRRFEQKW